MAKIELKFGAISTDDHVQEAPDTGYCVVCEYTAVRVVSCAQITGQ